MDDGHGVLRETTSGWRNTSGNTHAESFLDARPWAPLTLTDPVADPEPAPEPDPESGGLTLSATGYKIKGVKHADLAWNGATTSEVDVYADGVRVDTTPNDGASTVNLNGKGGGTHVFRVCESSTTSVCSPDVSVAY